MEGWIVVVTTEQYPNRIVFLLTPECKLNGWQIPREMYEAIERHDLYQTELYIKGKWGRGSWGSNKVTHVGTLPVDGYPYNA